MKLELRGVIVPPEYDTPDVEDFIQRGIITPTSRLESAIRNANGEDIEIYVNSVGGDCLAGNSLLDAIRAYPGGITIEVGALAASEAANIVLQTGRETVAHNNTIFLFHSARAIVEAGAEGLRDEARFIDLLNEPIKQALAAHGVPLAQITRELSEGRELLMSAEEALEYGIVSRIVEQEAAPVEPLTEEDSRGILSAIGTGFNLAAYTSARAGISVGMDTIKTVAEETPVEEEKPVEETTDKETEQAEDTRLEDLQKSVEALKSTVADMEQIISDLRGQNENLEKENETVKEDAEKAHNTVAELRATLAQEKKRHAALVGGVLANREADQPQDWKEAVKACGHDLKKAFQLYPHLAKAWKETH